MFSRNWLIGWLVLVAPFGMPFGAGCAHEDIRRIPVEPPASLEAELFYELNRLRANPAAYIPVLEKHKQGFVGNRKYLPGNVVLMTQEGVTPVDEAIEFLQEASRVHPLRLSLGISKAAADHVRDLGPEGKIGHFGTDGSSPGGRLQRYGKPQGQVAENIGFGEGGARNMVLILLVDDGVPDRGHRKKMLSDQYKLVGIACGAHKIYRTMCVIDFAEEFVEK